MVLWSRGRRREDGRQGLGKTYGAAFPVAYVAAVWEDEAGKIFE